MREVNFSNPHANKASVGITTALYDRRALDCTSTLPLIHSLNHLAYLTTSSARIREILTIDGGIERLVCILKNGKSKDMMDIWKWNLAFQCVVNIGVRGSDVRGPDARDSQNIRTRVVEADMVPVIATILDSHMQYVEKIKAKEGETEIKRSCSRFKSWRRSTEVNNGRRPSGQRTDESIQAPPPLEIPPTNDQLPVDSDADVVDRASVRRRLHGYPNLHHGHYHRHHPQRRARDQQGTVRNSAEEEAGIQPSDEALVDGVRLAMITVGVHGENASRPESPTTPTGPAGNRDTAGEGLALGSSPHRRPSTRAQQSTSDDSDDGQPEQPDMPFGEGGRREDPMVEIDVQDDVELDEVTDRQLLRPRDSTDGLAAPNVTGNADTGTFNITHRAADGSIVDPNATAPIRPLDFIPIPPAFTVADAVQEPPQTMIFAQSRTSHPAVLAFVPRDEDVIQSLQLLAFLTKYCNLRSYFQQSHLVPKLKIDRELRAWDGELPLEPGGQEDNDEEYCHPNDYNIFPLVEKFTVPYHSHDMKYWAAIVMKNLCRKDKSRADIRQCAYHKCGKWEDYARQFAKCRRCRQTKYCSKECQKNAWVYHRHWCSDPNQ